MYAVRKAAYEPMYPEACSDFLICTLLYRKGLRSVLEEEAVCFEQTNQRPANELHMRIRVIAQTFTDMWRNRDMMNPFKSGFYAIQLLSHKLLRYAIPLFLVGALASAIWLSETSMAFALITMVQVAFYAAGTLGWILVKTGWNIRLLTIPFYFILGNIAIVRGFAKFLRGERYAKWEPARSFS
jgi:hypothetical protein